MIQLASGALGPWTELKVLGERTLSETTTVDEPTRVFLLIENRLVRETLVRLFRKRSDLSCGRRRLLDGSH